MITSVFFSSENIRIIVGSQGGKYLNVKQCVSGELAQGSMINGVITNENDVKFTLAKLWENNRLPSSDIRIIIDSSSVMTKSIIVPRTKEANVLSIIKREFGDVETDEELIYDYFVLNPSREDGGAEVLACAVEKKFVGGYIELFSAVGPRVKVSSVDLAVDCAIKFWRYVPELSEKTAILAVLDGNMLSLTLFVNGKYRFTNRSRLIEERGLPQSVDEISNLLSSMIQFNRSERSGYEVSDIYFCGLNDDEYDLCPYIKNILETQNISEFPECSGSIAYKGGKHSSEIPVPEKYVYCLGNLINM